MSNIDNFFLGNPLKKPEQKPVTDKEMYQYMLEQGKRRFGSPCRHEEVANGRCKVTVCPIMTG